MHASRNLAVTVVGVAAVAVLAGVAWFGTGTSTPPRAADADVTYTATAPPGSVTVHVSGEVANPGLVVVPVEARIADVVRAAGGATPDAELSLINLAAPVRDGDHVVVPVVGDGDGDGASVNEGIDLNRADAAELEGLPGVGPVLAQRIVAYRDEYGPFTVVEDLLDVPGIGEAKLEQLRAAVSAP